MIKLIELNPEWILNEIPISHYADGNGNISIDTDSSTDAKWLMLALNTLCIPYQEDDFGDGDTNYFGFNFRIEDIKKDCPTLYICLKEMDAKNKIYKDLNLN
jgi:hypothetical protein